MSDPSLIVLGIQATALPSLGPQCFGSKTGTPPTEPTHYDYTIYLINRGSCSFTAEMRTGGYYSLDDVLIQSKGMSTTVVVPACSASVLSTPDEGAFDETFYYAATLQFESGSRFAGVFGVSRYGRAPLDLYEHDPVLQTRVRVIRARSWDILGS